MGLVCCPSSPLPTRCVPLQVKRCDEMARRVRFFHEQVEKAGLLVKAKAMQEDKTYEFDELEVCACSASSAYIVQ